MPEESEHQIFLKKQAITIFITGMSLILPITSRSPLSLFCTLLPFLFSAHGTLLSFLLSHFLVMNNLHLENIHQLPSTILFASLPSALRRRSQIAPVMVVHLGQFRGTTMAGNTAQICESSTIASDVARSYRFLYRTRLQTLGNRKLERGRSIFHREGMPCVRGLL